jgi:dolichyl-phosphate mannosyltransferase polypeptide 3
MHNFRKYQQKKYKMTKLLEWVFGAGLAGLLWIAMLNGYFFTFGIPFFHVQFLPIYGVLLFGIYSVVVILYRVATFNDCPEAAEELRRQVVQAKADLSSKGIKFESSKTD